MLENLMCGLLGGTVSFALDMITKPENEEEDTSGRHFACMAAGVTVAVVAKVVLSKGNKD